jgi:hypothetical protein
MTPVEHVRIRQRVIRAQQIGKRRASIPFPVQPPLAARFDAEHGASSSSTSIDLRHANSCDELISPKYSTCRCTTRPHYTHLHQTRISDLKKIKSL